MKSIKTQFAIFGLLLFSNITLAQTMDWTKKSNPVNNQINGIAFRADGKKVVSGTNCMPASIRMFDVATSNLDWDFTVGGTYHCIMGVSMSSNNNYIAAIEENGNIFIFDNTGASPVSIDTINTGTTYAFCTAIAPDNDKVAVGCSNGKLKIYKINGGSAALDLNAHTNWVTTVAFTPDGSKIVSGGSDDKVKIWSSTGTLLNTCSGHTGDITNVRITPDNKYVVSSSNDKTIKVWDIANGNLVKTITGHTKAVSGVDISPDGARLVSCSADSTCKIWELSTANLMNTFSMANKNAFTAVAWSPNGDKIATGNVISDLAIWSVQGPADVKEITLDNKMTIYPNPAQHNIQIELPFLPSNGTITLYNQLGQVQKVFKNINSPINDFDLTEMPQGQYFIRYEDEQFKIIAKLCVIK